MLKSTLMLFATLAIVNPAFAVKKGPLLNEKDCAAQIDADLQKIYENSPYGYKGGGYMSGVVYAGQAHSIINFMTPGWGSSAEDEVAVTNIDCKVLSKSTIWTD